MECIMILKDVNLLSTSRLRRYDICYGLTYLSLLSSRVRVLVDHSCLSNDAK